MTYVLKNDDPYGVFSWAVNIPLMLLFTAVAALGQRPWQGI